MIVENIQQKYLRSPEVLFETIDDESVLLNLIDGYYYGLNSCGRVIWDLLETPKTIGELSEQVAKTFGQNIEQVEVDVAEFCRALHGPKLIKEA